MTRQEWIDRYVAAMLEGESRLTKFELIGRAEADCDSTERAGGDNPDEWESPEEIAQEHLESEKG